jgi:hypothetical protein
MSDSVQIWDYTSGIYTFCDIFDQPVLIRKFNVGSTKLEEQELPFAAFQEAELTFDAYIDGFIQIILYASFYRTLQHQPRLSRELL